jgi:hypothetical protein
MNIIFIFLKININHINILPQNYFHKEKYQEVFLTRLSRSFGNVQMKTGSEGHN